MDRSVVERAQRGDRDAFAALVHAVSDRLYALAYRILRDPELAQDAFQEAMISASANIRVLEIEAHTPPDTGLSIHDRFWLLRANLR